MSESKRMLTASQVAERWGCDPSTVRKLARTRRLAAMRLGTDWRFSLAAVEAFERGHTAEPERSGTGAVAEVVYSTAEPRIAFDLPADYEPVFPRLWGMEPTTTPAAPSAAGRSRSAGKKKAAQAGT